MTSVKKANVRALLRFPGEEIMAFAGNQVIPQNGLPPVSVSKSFIYRPFNAEGGPGWLLNEPISPDEALRDIRNWEGSLPEHGWDSTSKEKYVEGAQRLLSQLTSGELKKVVYSRVITTKRPTDFSASGCFEALIEKYPEATVHLFAIEGEECWIGASPECLMEYHGNSVRTVSLAGTQKIEHPETETFVWGEKEREEQALVTAHISQVFQTSPHTHRVAQDGPHTLKAGTVAHLQTEFHAQTEPGFDWRAMLKALHPTPAIAGYPKEKALEVIEQCEAHKRSYYGGYFGITGDHFAKLYLNLRCMRFDRHRLQLFVGGGYTSDSSVESEWQETAHKAQTLLSVIENLRKFESS